MYFFLIYLSSLRGLEIIVYMFHVWLLRLLYACILKALALSYWISLVCLYVMWSKLVNEGRIVGYYIIVPSIHLSLPSKCFSKGIPPSRYLYLYSLTYVLIQYSSVPMNLLLSYSSPISYSFTSRIQKSLKFMEIVVDVPYAWRFFSNIYSSLHHRLWNTFAIRDNCLAWMSAWCLFSQR